MMIESDVVEELLLLTAGEIEERFDYAADFTVIDCVKIRFGRGGILVQFGDVAHQLPISELFRALELLAFRLRR